MKICSDICPWTLSQCSSNLTAFLKLPSWKTVGSSEQMSMHKSELIIHQIFSLMCDTCRSKHVTWQNIPQLKLENIQEYSPSFKAAHVAEKICRMLNTISLHFGQKYARIFVLGLSVPRSSQFSSSYALRKLFGWTWNR